MKIIRPYDTKSSLNLNELVEGFQEMIQVLDNLYILYGTDYKEEKGYAKIDLLEQFFIDREYSSLDAICNNLVPSSNALKDELSAWYDIYDGYLENARNLVEKYVPVTEKDNQTLMKLEEYLLSAGYFLLEKNLLLQDYYMNFYELKESSDYEVSAVTDRILSANKDVKEFIETIVARKEKFLYINLELDVPEKELAEFTEEIGDYASIVFRNINKFSYEEIVKITVGQLKIEEVLWEKGLLEN